MPGRVDPNSYEIQQIMLTYDVNIHIKPVRAAMVNCSLTDQTLTPSSSKRGESGPWD